MGAVYLTRWFGTVFENPSVNMIEDVGSYELKSYHAGPDWHVEMVLKEPHAWIADHKSALPSDVIFEVSVHISRQRLVKTLEYIPMLLLLLLG